MGTPISLPLHDQKLLVETRKCCSTRKSRLPGHSKTEKNVFQSQHLQSHGFIFLTIYLLSYLAFIGHVPMFSPTRDAGTSRIIAKNLPTTNLWPVICGQPYGKQILSDFILYQYIQFRHSNHQLVHQFTSFISIIIMSSGSLIINIKWSIMIYRNYHTISLYHTNIIYFDWYVIALKYYVTISYYHNNTNMVYCECLLSTNEHSI